MAVSNVYVYCGEGGLTVADVNRLSDSLSKNRQWDSHEGISLTSLTVITEEDESLFYDQGGKVSVKPLSKDYGGFWNHINCYKQGSVDQHEEDKVIVITGPVIAHDLTGIPMLESVPTRGMTENAAQNIDKDDKALIQDENLYPVQQFNNWFDDETDFIPWYIGIPAATARMMYNKFDENLEELQNDYDSTPYGLQQYIECELEEVFFWMHQPKGILAPYALHDRDKQLKRNGLWESNVRPWFVDEKPDGYGWRGLGGEAESLLWEFEHEWRTISRQVSFIYFEGDTDTVLEDEFARWWIL